ncbi:hypothetical protein LWI28_022584 [Acer negundo]|uniref:F-box domain-containing protein n=1 Tax=Acer negundo TaxID=4023 RepID=A0AAD5NY74_ACENE|nr:hypothetical protein LWI28_022584 [Acer negundo]KAK4852391.1 hypothetical protein QYF36_023572 [Acer negundo]
MKKTEWSDLPYDIVRFILEKLCYSERVPLYLVCKNWHDRIREIKNTKEFLPWLMYYKGQKGNRIICKLGDPSTRRIYTVKKTPTQIYKNRDLSGAVPCQSRFGWVLFSKGFDNIAIKHLFFYNPFTNQVIELPKLGNIYRSASFSKIPTCPDCMVIALRIPKTGQLEIKTWQPGYDTWLPGYDTWKTFKFSGEYDRDRTVISKQVAYTGESFYCIFSDLNRNVKKIGAFNTKRQEWQEFSGSISGPGLWRFDLSEKKWVVEDDKILEKQVIFIDHSSLLTPAKGNARQSFSVPAKGNARQSAGKIIGDALVLHRDNYFIVHPWWPPQLYGFIIEDDYEKLQKIWIQPPF